MTPDPIERVRLFMQTCGETRTSWPYPVTVMRVIAEVAKRGTVQVRFLRARLGVDKGYLSRILNRLETDGIVVRQQSTVDKRALLVRSTPRCDQLGSAYRACSERPIRVLLAALDTVGQRRLLEAIDMVCRASPT